MSDTIQIPEKPVRNFLPADFRIDTWDNLKPYYDELANRPIDSADALRNWLKDRSELESVISEDMGWRYIRMTRYTDNEEYSAALILFRIFSPISRHFLMN